MRHSTLTSAKRQTRLRQPAPGVVHMKEVLGVARLRGRHIGYIFPFDQPNGHGTALLYDSLAGPRYSTRSTG
jgi:hypothetical protein